MHRTATLARRRSVARGVFEKVAGSGVWWIRYFAEGRKRRECIGRYEEAVDAYYQRKAEEHREAGRLPPEGGC
jgi:hypothetical protein